MSDPHLTPPEELEDRDEQPGSQPSSSPAPDNLTLRRRMLEETLVSEKLRNNIEVILLHGKGRTLGWNELMSETDEIRNEVAKEALNSLASFNPNRARPLSWLMGIAINVIRAHRRRQKRDQGNIVPQSAFSEEQWKHVLEHLSTDQRDGGSERDESVWQGIERLNPEEQRLLQLHYLQGMNYAQLAAVFSLSEQTLRKRNSRALHSLRKIIKSQQRRDNP